jgi:hypothetical protein
MKELFKEIAIFVFVGLLVIFTIKILGLLLGLSEFSIGWFSGITTTLIYKSLV